ncbi:MAG: caspase family protein [Burkholderiaceae bacterium]
MLLPRHFFRAAFAALVLGLAALQAWAASPPPEKRVALVIGNSAYKTSPLRNPTNDARDMAAKLRSMGFEVVERSNLRTRQIGQTLREFRSKLTPSTVALVFYAGHGLQIRGENYLPAVDAEIDSEEDVPNQSLSMRQVMEVLDDSKTRLNLVFLDACRNNPYQRGFRSAAGEGLARVSAPSGTLISYATRPGSVAADGNGKNGLYTGHLLKQMEAANQPVEQVLKRVVSAVKTESQGRQEPWMEGSIEGDFCFGNCGQVVASASRSAAELEDEYWDGIKAGREAAVFEEYMRRYPSGRYVAQARVRLASLKADPASAAAAREQEAAFWRSAETGGTKSDLEAYLAQYPQGQFVATARTKIAGLAEAEAKKAAATPAPAIKVDPDLYISDKIRGEMAASKALLPSNAAGDGKSVVVKHYVEDTNGRRPYTMTISNRQGLCTREYSSGVTMFYQAVGVLPAGSTKAMRFLDERVVKAEQGFDGNISTLSPGQRMVVTVKSRGLPGDTTIEVGETKPNWPEFSFPYPATQLKVVRDFETHGGYVRSEDVMLYATDLGCAIPVSENIREIFGNKMFGTKVFAKVISTAYEMGAR